MKENMGRIVFWGFIMVLTILASIVGYNNFNTGHGKKGMAKAKLTPIVNNFKGVESIITHGNIDVKLKTSSIVITDKNTNSTYTYKYTTNDGINMLSSEFKTDDKVGETICKALIDAVYWNNGGNGSVFKLYLYEAFGFTKIQQGVALERGAKTKVKIDIDKNVIAEVRRGEVDLSMFAIEEDPAKLILGTWYFVIGDEKETNTYLTFETDGTGTYCINGAVSNITYKITGSKISIDAPGLDTPQDAPYVIEGDTLTINDKLDRSTVYKK